MDTDERKKQWHAPFCAAMRLELRKNKDILDFFPEYLLSSKPLQMDLLIVKKTKDETVENEIGKIFRGHNIIEYKSPGAALDIDTYYKVLGYACFYKALDEHAEEIQPEDITVTLIREAYPRELMKFFKRQGFTVTQEYKGIYYVQGTGYFPTQIIVSKKVDKKNHIWLTSLTRKMQQIQAEALLREMNGLNGKAERLQAEAVLDLVMRSNHEIFGKVKEENPMCGALYELMKPEIDAMLEKNREETWTEAWTEARTITLAEARAESVEHIIKEFGVPLEKACQVVRISLEEYRKVKERTSAAE